MYLDCLDVLISTAQCNKVNFMMVKGTLIWWDIQPLNIPGRNETPCPSLGS